MEVGGPFENLSRPAVPGRLGQQEVAGHLLERGTLLVEEPGRLGVGPRPAKRVDLAIDGRALEGVDEAERSLTLEEMDLGQAVGHLMSYGELEAREEATTVSSAPSPRTAAA